MVLLMISILFVLKTIYGQEQYILAGQDRCFDSLSYDMSHMFKAPYDGQIIGIRLVHKSGIVTCNTNTHPNSQDWTLWGCAGAAWIFIEMVKVGFQTVYPTTNTEGISNFQLLTCPAEGECSVQYYDLAGYDGRTSPYIEFRETSNPRQVYIQDTFSLQYGEGCCDVARTDNAGVGCADVYFIYTRIDTDNPSTYPTRLPSKNPSISPTPAPTSNPTAAPTNDPTPSPTTIPTISPTFNPTQSPTNSTQNPTHNPTQSPVIANSAAATNIPSSTTDLPTNSPIEDGIVSYETTRLDDEQQKTANDDKNGQVGLMIGIGVALVLILAGICAYLYVKRRKMNKEVTFDDW